jgi:hypothetical protein
MTLAREKAKIMPSGRTDRWFGEWKPIDGKRTLAAVLPGCQR